MLTSVLTTARRSACTCTFPPSRYTRRTFCSSALSPSSSLSSSMLLSFRGRRRGFPLLMVVIPGLLLHSLLRFLLREQHVALPPRYPSRHPAFPPPRPSKKHSPWQPSWRGSWPRRLRGSQRESACWPIRPARRGRHVSVWGIEGARPSWKMLRRRRRRSRQKSTFSGDKNAGGLSRRGGGPFRPGAAEFS